MIVSVFVHPIDQDAHPTVPLGFRWAVHLGANPVAPFECLNAGWCPSVNEASIEGEMVGVAVAKALRMAGHACDYAVRTLEFDPIPAQHDRLQVG